MKYQIDITDAELDRGIAAACAALNATRLAALPEAARSGYVPVTVANYPAYVMTNAAESYAKTYPADGSKEAIMVQRDAALQEKAALAQENARLEAENATLKAAQPAEAIKG